MSDDRDEDGRSAQRYAPPDELGLDPEHHDKFTLSGEHPFYVVEKDGRRVQIVTDEHGEVKRIPA